MQPRVARAVRDRQHRQRRASRSPCARYSASDQKCGGVQTKMMRNSSSASGGTSLVTAAQPSTGGIAPEAPPITMFCGVAGFSSTV